MKGKPTLLMVAPYFPPHGGGLEKYAYEISVRLQHLDWNVVVITSGDHHGTERKENYDGLTVYRLGYDFKISNTPFSFSWFRQIPRIIKEVNPNIIDVHMPVPGIGDVTTLFSGSRPLVVTYHAGSMHKKKLLTDILIWLYEHIPLPLLLLRANRIICSSEFVYKDFLRRYQYKSVTVTPAVDVELFTPAPAGPPEKPTLLFVAGLGWAEQHKGLMILLKAVKSLEVSMPDLSLIVVGEGDMRPEYESRVATLQLSNRVTFTGRLTGETLVHAYQRASALVLPSYAPAESFGMVLIEAMACKLPVIGSRMGGIPTVITDGVDGVLVKPNSVSALAEAIQTLFSDQSKLIAMGERGLQKVRSNYYWDKKVVETDRFLWQEFV